MGEFRGRIKKQRGNGWRWEAGKIPVGRNWATSLSPPFAIKPRSLWQQDNFRPIIYGL